MIWYINIFQQKMACDRFKEIMKYLQFDLKTTRYENFQTEQFALVGDLKHMY